MTHTETLGMVYVDEGSLLIEVLDTEMQLFDFILIPALLTPCSDVSNGLWHSNSFVIEHKCHMLPPYTEVLEAKALPKLVFIAQVDVVTQHGWAWLLILYKSKTSEKDLFHTFL